MGAYELNHFLADSFTRPWEDGNGDLHYVDVERQVVERGRSKDLFARRGLFSPAAEALFARSFEQPVGEIRKKLRRGRLTKLTDPEGQALALACLLGTARVGAALNVEGAHLPPMLEEIAGLERKDQDAALAHFAGILYRDRGKAVLFDPGAPLFMPMTCVFSLPLAVVAREPPFVFGNFLALAPHALLALVPREASLHERDPWLTPERLRQASAGAPPHASRVIVPPQMLGRADLVADVRQAQAANVEAFQACHALRDRWTERRDALRSSTAGTARASRR